MSLLIIAHIYYSTGWEYLLERLENLNKYPCKFIFNVVNLSFDKEDIKYYIDKNFPDAIIIDSSEHGRDIGGKLAAIDLSIKMKIESELTLIIHDKQSSHTLTGIAWRNELFRVIEKNELPYIFSRFEKNAKTGIIGSKKFIMSEYNFANKRFDSVSDDILRKIITEMNFMITDFNFIAGNVFWIRSKIINDFFSKNSALKIRSKLERGNVLDFHQGTYIHSWERIFSWLANMYGFDMIGI